MRVYYVWVTKWFLAVLGMTATAAVIATSSAGAGPGPNGLARTPPMGWMSWQVFRCETDCVKYPDACIDEQLYTDMADTLASDGYLQAGYSSVSIDDCWEDSVRDNVTGALLPDPARFPHGMAALGTHMHAVGARFGIYSDVGTRTCGGFLGSEGHETIDAETFAAWGVDYLKLDGCYSNITGYERGYPTMGAALQKTKRDIVYSCSWPAYLGGNESSKPYAAMIDAGCNSWRNWEDIQCGWSSVTQIIEHWGTWGRAMAPYAGPGHWHDPDMLVIGNGCLTHAEEQTQMALWSIVAAPLIMGNDLRNVSAASKAILLNVHAIAIDQDPLGKMGYRLTSDDYTTQIWARHLRNGDVAVALYNYNGGSPGGVDWVATDAYCSHAKGVGGVTGFGHTLATCRDGVANDTACASGHGYFYYNPGYNGQCMCALDDCTTRGAIQGYTIYKLDPDAPPNGTDITVAFAALELQVPRQHYVQVLDVWSGRTLAEHYVSNFTATNVSQHGTAFVRLSVQPEP